MITDNNHMLLYIDHDLLFRVKLKRKDLGMRRKDFINNAIIAGASFRDELKPFLKPLGESTDRIRVILDNDIFDILLAIQERFIDVKNISPSMALGACLQYYIFLNRTAEQCLNPFC